MYGEHVYDMPVLLLFLDSDTRALAFEAPLGTLQSSFISSKAQFKVAKRKGQLEIKFYLYSSLWEQRRENAPCESGWSKLEIDLPERRGRVSHHIKL